MANKPQRRPLNDRWKAEALKDSAAPAAFDLRAMFDLQPLRNAAPPAPARPITPLVSCASVDTVEREFWIPFSPPQFHVKKDGSIKERKMKVTLIASTVTIQTGTAAPVAMFRATNRGATIIKHPVESTDAAGKMKWTGPRVPLCEVNRELIRLLGAADAAPIAAQLAALQPAERAAKVRPRATPITGIPECLSKWNRQPSAEAAPLTDKAIEALSDEEFAARLAGTFDAMNVITRAGTPEFYN